MAEVNCVPLSEVSCTRTPHLEIQPATRVSAQVTAAMSRMGSASSQREDQRTTVNRYLLPQVAAGRGPTMSTWMWVKGLAGMVIGCTAAVCCLETLALSHCWKFVTHDPCGHVAVETSPHDPGDNQLLGGPRAGMG